MTTGTDFDASVAVVMDDLSVRGKLVIPAGSITSANWASNASKRLGSEKKQHQKTVTWSTATTATTMAPVTQGIYLANGAATIEQVSFRIETLPTSSKQIEVDIHKASAGSGSYASVQSGTINQSSSDTASTAKDSPGITGGTLTAGDSLRLVITESGSGTQGIGGTVIVVLKEAPY